LIEKKLKKFGNKNAMIEKNKEEKKKSKQDKKL